MQKHIILVASFAHIFQAQEAARLMREAHIVPVWEEIFPGEKINATALPTLILELHGIKEIVQLQSLFAESICKNTYALTVDIISQKVQQEKIIGRL